MSPTIDWASPPEQVRLPNIAELKQLPPKELKWILDRFGITAPWSQLRSAAVGYVQRMTDYPPGSELFKKSVSDLVEGETTRSLRSMTKRAYREFIAMDQMDGDVHAEFIRISEGGTGMCPSCAGKAGEMGDMAYHAAIGKPGASSCYGGDDCRCQLVRVD